VSVLLTPQHFSFPVYAQVEANSTTYLDGTAALPRCDREPRRNVFIAPEVFLGSVRQPDQRRDARWHWRFRSTCLAMRCTSQTYTVTAAFDIPNPYGY